MWNGKFTYYTYCNFLNLENISVTRFITWIFIVCPKIIYEQSDSLTTLQVITGTLNKKIKAKQPWIKEERHRPTALFLRPLNLQATFFSVWSRVLSPGNSSRQFHRRPIFNKKLPITRTLKYNRKDIPIIYVQQYSMYYVICGTTCIFIIRTNFYV